MEGTNCDKHKIGIKSDERGAESGTPPGARNFLVSAVEIFIQKG